jgi:hypothetical protein
LEREEMERALVRVVVARRTAARVLKSVVASMAEGEPISQWVTVWVSSRIVS